MLVSKTACDRKKRTETGKKRRTIEKREREKKERRKERTGERETLGVAKPCFRDKRQTGVVY